MELNSRRNEPERVSSKMAAPCTDEISMEHHMEPDELQPHILSNFETGIKQTDPAKVEFTSDDFCSCHVSEMKPSVVAALDKSHINSGDIKTEVKSEVTHMNIHLPQSSAAELAVQYVKVKLEPKIEGHNIENSVKTLSETTPDNVCNKIQNEADYPSLLRSDCDVTLEMKNTPKTALDDIRPEELWKKTSVIKPFSEELNRVIPEGNRAIVVEPGNPVDTFNHQPVDANVKTNMNSTFLQYNETFGGLTSLNTSKVSESIHKRYTFSETVTGSFISNMNRGQNANNKPIACPHCSKRFKYRSHLKKHIVTHTNEKPFSCTHCERRFNLKSVLNQHKLTHTESGEKPFPCPHCNKGCSRKSDLTVHMRTHTGERPFPCHHCDKRFKNRAHLIDHLLSHTGERPFPCDQCDKRFKNKSQLVDHIRTHGSERPFPCLDCGKRFYRRSILTQHIQTHTGVKPFPCLHCDKGFARKSDLTVHLRTHSGEKPFLCPYCDKRYKNKPHLVDHIRTHTCEKPFSCPHCNKRFHRKSILTKHTRIHVNDSLVAS